jgi:Ca2+-binding EF-hand superfamily protein
MKAKSMLLAVAGLFIVAGASAQSTPMPTDQAPGRHQPAAKLDKDGDGAISREEANAKKRLAAHFDALDSNKDGKLSKEELHTARAKAHEKHKGAFEKYFKDADKDGDGMLSKAEAENSKMPGLATHFEKADANQDGKASKEELQAGRKRMHDEHAVRIKAADKDGDGALTKAEAEAGKLHALVRHFDQLDVNKDGKVGPEEVHARKGKPKENRDAPK